MQQQSNSNNCGKVCLWSCLGCVGLTVLFTLVVWVGTCMGCALLAPVFGDLFSSIGNVAKIQGYFDDLKADGWEVDDSQSNQPSGYGANVEFSAPMIWKARENPDDDWTLYVWELAPADIEAFENMAEGRGEMDWTAMLNWTLIPRTEEALEVHEELGLSLPDDFELIPWDEDSGTGTRTHDKIPQNNDEETQNNDEEDRTNEEDNTDNSGGEDREEETPRRRPK